jgi:hypothetical protein
MANKKKPSKKSKAGSPIEKELKDSVYCGSNPYNVCVKKKIKKKKK